MIILGDSLQELQLLPPNSVDSIVTDPPYGLSFMGKKWDYDVPTVELWIEAIRVLKPGGYLLAFAGTRTQHRMAVNIEDAGFEIRDMIAWVYGSGFPKSHNIGKALDRQAGAVRERVKVPEAAKDSVDYGKFSGEIDDNNPITEEAKKYDGWGTALKPALEPITVARKPFKGTVANNVLEWGTGGINIDGSRVAPTDDVSGWSKTGSKESENTSMSGKNYDREPKQDNPQGRFPANLIHDGSDEVVGLFPETTKGGKPKTGTQGYNNKYVGGEKVDKGVDSTFHDSGGGSAARFFYTAKSSKRERNKGLDGFNCAIIDICKDVNTEQVTSLLKDILESIPNLSIDESGLKLTVTYPKDTMSTILTTIKQITDLKTYSLLMQSPTRESMKGVLSKMMNGSSPVESVKSSSELTMTTGTSQEKDGLATEDVRNATYQRLLKLKDESEWKPRTSTHPTVKPVRLMQYLVKLVTPVGGTVLDPFNGSGTTGIACKLEGFKYIGIELDPEYVKLSEARIEAWTKENKLDV